MSEASSHSVARSKGNEGYLDRMLRRDVWGRLENLDHGRLLIDDGGIARNSDAAGRAL